MNPMFKIPFSAWLKDCWSLVRYMSSWNSARIMITMFITIRHIILKEHLTCKESLRFAK